MNKMTPGKWEYKLADYTFRKKQRYEVKTMDDGFVSRVICDLPWIDKFKDHKANAQAISALPELVEALELAYANLGAVGVTEHTFGYVRNQIKHALAKVEGKE